MPGQIFHSPQVKRCVIISNKHGVIISNKHGKNELPHELLNDSRLTNLGNYKYQERFKAS